MALMGVEIYSLAIWERPKEMEIEKWSPNQDLHSSLEEVQCEQRENQIEKENQVGGENQKTLQSSSLSRINQTCSQVFAQVNMNRILSKGTKPQRRLIKQTIHMEQMKFLETIHQEITGRRSKLW